MFDITKKLPESKKPKSSSTSSNITCSLVYQTEECRNLVEELFEFEGWDCPIGVQQHKADSEFYSKQESNLILLELNESSNVVADAQAVAAKLPTHKGVIVIGKEDAISTLRSLKEMGFYYLFWPINKYEFAEFVMHVNNDLKAQRGVSKERRAKRVAVVGSKGGVGTSFIATELGTKLAGEGVDTILVDHQYSGSGTDVLLGLTEFSARQLDELSVPLHELDMEGALSYLTSVSSELRLLSIQGNAEQQDLLNYNQTLCELLVHNTNFIVEDYSGSVDFPLDCDMLVRNYDVIAIVIEPTVTAVRKAKALISEIDTSRDLTKKRTRIVTVVNHHRPNNNFPIAHDDVTKFLGASVDLDFEYCKQLAHLQIDGKRVYKHDRSVNRSIDQLARLVNGQPINANKSILQRLGWR
ncbi:CobQ/CobB/MinD/ParA nucleotide binding domain protein [Vibrio mediterranei]|jgi:pilus assembly protein CpaE|uniref:AAA family ATPase n=1 Tax=Vibrio mediterranei TaxID=689 RepID=UPI0007831B46|nr:P-loop NTPase [Vibrio mediterranei]MCG9658679.1 P-loop NTPase [Vibrio mediterranei]MCG9661715.1 P-loop NTPase [Vibrio mediterranei]PTC04056.1 chromosome partitioning protein ParA [Vibrio mediterranei]SBO11806.1 CobQ/CobB/MinD/ParA nucleotide binding domain protein [Vibrio mediterranei]